jgi:Protein of unknown function (DUF4238)
MADKHHYVSQFHLRHFIDPNSASTPDPWLWVGDLKTKKIKRRAPKNLAWSRGMFDGPGGFADPNTSLEKHLAEIESAAAQALRSFCTATQGTRQEFPEALMRYIAWAAARNLTMSSLYQRWADETDMLESVVFEPPPQGWENIKMISRPHSLEHAEFGIKENVPADEVNAMLQSGWRLKFNHQDLLEIIHAQAWYLQARFFPRLCWLVLEAPEKASFVIGDRPVVWGFKDVLDVKPSMFRHPAVQLFAPLSRSFALFAYHADNVRPDIIMPSQVNSVIAAAADRWVAGSDANTVANAMNSVSVA